MTKIAITGGTGFIGSNLTDYLQRSEPETEIVLLDVAPPVIPLGPNTKYVYGDIRQFDSVLDAFSGCDEVYNLAGVLGTSELFSTFTHAVSTNILGCANVLEVARRLNVKRVYNVAKPNFSDVSENVYTMTKHSAELMGKMYQHHYCMSIATVRWLNAFGPYQHLYPVRKFLPTMILFALYNLPLEIYGSGNQTFDPIDAEDIARLTVHACRNLGFSEKVVDLGSGTDISCNDAAELILKVVNDVLQTTCGEQSKSTIAHLKMREGEDKEIELRADMSYWESVGVLPVISFEDTIRRTVDYIRRLPKYHLRNALSFYGKTPDLIDPSLEDLWSK